MTVLVWAGYRYFWQMPEWVEEIILKPVVFVLPVWIYLKTKQPKVTLVDLGFHRAKFMAILGWGVGFGLFLTLENLVIWWSKWSGISANVFLPSHLLISAAVSLATALTEEILYRGFLLDKIWQLTGRAYTANLLTTMLFVIGHLGVGVFRLNYFGNDLAVYLLTISVIGFTQGFIYLETRSVAATTMAHALWNFSNTLFI